MKSKRDSHRTTSSKFYKWEKSSGHKEDEVEVLRPVSDRLRVAMDSHGYHLAEGSTHHDEQVTKHINKWKSRSQAQMQSQLFDPISIIEFLHAFKMDCDNNGAHEGATV